MKLLILTSLMLGNLSQELTKASSLSKIEEIKESLKNQKTTWHACHLQLQSYKFPKHCFEINVLYAQFQNYFDEKCEEASWKSLYEMSQFLKNKNINLSCLERIQQSKKIHIYKSKDQSIKRALKKYLEEKN